MRDLEAQRGIPVTQVHCAGGPELYQGRHGNGVVKIDETDMVVFADGERFPL